MVDKSAIQSSVQSNVFDGSYPGGNESVTYLPYSAFDTSRLATYAVSVMLIVYGSFRSLNLDSQHNSRLLDNGCTAERNGAHRSPQWCHWHILGSYQAALMPLAASVSLLVMFLYFESLQLIFVVATCGTFTDDKIGISLALFLSGFTVLATAAFAFLLLPLCQMLLAPCSSSYHRNVLCFGRYQPSEIAAAVGGASLVALWLVTGHWLLMDLLAMGLCVAFIALVRLPSLKVSTLLLVGLLLYDIFWVFFSSYLFQTNVMVRVATRQVDSPLAILVSTFGSVSTSAPVVREQQFVIRSSGSSQVPVHTFEHIPVHQHFLGNSVNNGVGGSATKLSLPGKLVFPSWQSGRYTMLGLGDIVVPGLLLCFVLRFENYISNQAFRQQRKPTGAIGHDIPTYSSFIISNTRLTYFRCSLIGYFFGLITATICSEFFRSAQPALLYLVPFTLIPLVFMSYVRGDLRIMWNFSGINGSDSDSSALLLKSSSSASSPALLLSNSVNLESCCMSVPQHDLGPPPEFDKPPPYTPPDTSNVTTIVDVKCSV